MERARLLANRSGSVFCLIAFEVDQTQLEGTGIDVLAEILHERLRITDDKGFLEDGRVGVVLPDTPLEGAQLVADDVQRRFLEAGGTLAYEIFVYPCNFDLDGNLIDTEQQPDLEGAEKSRVPVRPMDPLFAVKLPVWKRAADLIGALLLLVPAIPVMAVAAILIRSTSPGPVLFVQWRRGLGGSAFRMYKLRTMCRDAEAAKADLRPLSEQDGPAFKLKRDPRVTKIGQFLRSSSIDELPQLWNVLRGEMSIVGPRPMDAKEADECEFWQRRRLDVTPGLTCIWQVCGRSSVAFSQWIRMDLEYVERVTFLGDLKLVLLTVPSVLARKGAY